jgi:hypothetical protein
VAGISSPDTPHRLPLLREVANALAKPTRSHEDNIIILACSIFTKKTNLVLPPELHNHTKHLDLQAP